MRNYFERKNQVKEVIGNEFELGIHDFRSLEEPGKVKIVAPIYGPFLPLVDRLYSLMKPGWKIDTIMLRGSTYKQSSVEEITIYCTHESDATTSEYFSSESILDQSKIPAWDRRAILFGQDKESRALEEAFKGTNYIPLTVSEMNRSLPQGGKEIFQQGVKKISVELIKIIGALEKVIEDKKRHPELESSASERLKELESQYQLYPVNLFKGSHLDPLPLNLQKKLEEMNKRTNFTLEQAVLNMRYLLGKIFN